MHCTVRETTDSLEVNLSFLFCRKELWRRRRRHSYKERTLYYNFGVSLRLKNYYCLEKARLASNQLGASSNGWHLICGEKRRSGREIGASPLAKVQAAAARCILAARQEPPSHHPRPSPPPPRVHDNSLGCCVCTSFASSVPTSTGLSLLLGWRASRPTPKSA